MHKAKRKSKGATRARSSVSGRFVKPGYAKRYPARTVVERIKARK